METKPRLIAIIGPTASGKTALALDVAERWNGEIICADSRTVYKHMDIGTAKPTDEERARIKHWGIDLVEPNEKFTAADFKNYAQNIIKDIQSRGKLPLLVGGTGLYVNSVLYDYNFGGSANLEKRAEFEKMSLKALHEYCTKHNVILPENSKNKRYVIRAIERKSMTNISKTVLDPSLRIVGIATNMNTLRTRIEQRAEQLFQDNVAGEATLLGKKYGWNSEAMTGNIYPLIKKQLAGELSEGDVKNAFKTADYQLAKRQMTWFRRNPDIMWCTRSGAASYINSLLARE